MTDRVELLKLFKANAGHTVVKPPVINTDINRMTGYFPAKVTEYRVRRL
jgi:hypothetical protein